MAEMIEMHFGMLSQVVPENIALHGVYCVDAPMERATFGVSGIGFWELEKRVSCAKKQVDQS